MTPHRIVLENFLSFGSPAVEIVFDDSEPLWVISGPNGVGKSTVFDAITYALFGCHRGGRRQRMADLIHHGSNSFRVELEFSTGHDRYRIIRNYGRRSIDRIFHAVGSEWREVDLEASGKSVHEWVEEELGLTFEQFVASVLLRQGEADKIITASGRDRLDMLKRIVGLDRFEDLANQVNEGRRQAVTQRDTIRSLLAAIPPVSDDELRQAQQGYEQAEHAFQQARNNETAAAARVEQARRYQSLQAEALDLQQKLAAAEERRLQAPSILKRYNRWVMLTEHLPRVKQRKLEHDRLRQLEPLYRELQNRVEQSLKTLHELCSQLDAVRSETDTFRRQLEELSMEQQTLRRDCEVAERNLQCAEELADIDRQLAEFPADLEERWHHAVQHVNECSQQLAKAVQEETQTATLLKERQADLAAFEQVGVGAICSRCRQPVTAEHAAKEKALLQSRCQDAEQAAAIAANNAVTLRSQLQAAEDARQKLADLRQRRDQLRSHRLGLARFGNVPAPAAALQQLQDITRRLQSLQPQYDAIHQQLQHSSTRFTALQTERQRQEQHTEEQRSELLKTQQALLLAQDRIRNLSELIPQELKSIETDEEIQKLHLEAEALKAEGVDLQARQLENDEARWSEWQSRMNDIHTALATISDDARVPVNDAEFALTHARSVTTAAGQRRDQAQIHLLELQRQFQRYHELLEQDRQSERIARLHEKLVAALGPRGLQRDLVRSAEQHIAQYANETVQHLSDGDLTIELDRTEDSVDRALTLLVRRSWDPTPISVNYLSGSQKFRVAVAVALAIGRFATAATHARPLESVIIDEGFGSLDKDGLRCMADELTRLKDRAALRRIILVSHQDEFVQRFPVGWRLSFSPSGTQATRFRL